MNGRIGCTLLGIGLSILSASTLLAQERWIYRYDGDGNSMDRANSIVMGSDGNLYAAGLSNGSEFLEALTVVSLTNSGVERWIYQYNGPGNNIDYARSIVMGLGGNLYAAGASANVGLTDIDFTIVSLTDSGAERWVYSYDGPGHTWDEAYSMALDMDDNLYVAGYSQGVTTGDDFTVISLADSGVERWVYRYDGPAGTRDVAGSIVMGLDGNLYAAGWSAGIGSDYDFTVVSLTPSGTERWVYRYMGPASRKGDGAYSIISGLDGNLYAAGAICGSENDCDFMVVSLTPSGVERWVYCYDGPGGGADLARSITMGRNGNLYAAGYSMGVGTDWDFTAVSLTDSGVERWVYRYDGVGNSWDEVYSITVGLDGNIYAAGSSQGNGTADDFTVVSLTDSGVERWVYRYDGPANSWDGAHSIIMGSDSSVYVAGYSKGNGPEGDIIVVSLSPDVGMQEGLDRPSTSGFRLSQNSPNPFQLSTLISYSLPQATDVTLSIHDITGRLVATLVNETQQPGTRQVRWHRKNNPSGVYFYRLEAGESVAARKMVVVD